MTTNMREPTNVPEFLEREALLARVRSIRAEAVLDKQTWEHWNRTHPTEAPLDTAFEDAVIAWCDGKGPMPTLPAKALSEDPSHAE